MNGHADSKLLIMLTQNSNDGSQLQKQKAKKQKNLMILTGQSKCQRECNDDKVVKQP